MTALAQPASGFSFENALRNSSLEAKNLGLPRATSTGTTIVGVVYDSGIVLGADTRATEGPIVADKNCEKVRPCPPSPLSLSLSSSSLTLSTYARRFTTSPSTSAAAAPARPPTPSCASRRKRFPTPSRSRTARATAADALLLHACAARPT